MQNKKPISIIIIGFFSIIYGLFVAWTIAGFMTGERGSVSFIRFAPLAFLYLIGGIEILFLRNLARRLLAWSFPISVILLLAFCLAMGGVKQGFSLFGISMLIVCMNPLLIGPPIGLLIYFSLPRVKKNFSEAKKGLPESTKGPLLAEIIIIALMISGGYFFFSRIYSEQIEKYLCTGYASDYRPADFPDNYTVIEVIDGNTLKLSNGEIVSLIGVDAPEIEANDKAKSDSERTGEDIDKIIGMGRESRRFVERLVNGKKVSLGYDFKRKDKKGHLLAEVYIIGFTKSEIINFSSEGIVQYDCVLKEGVDISKLNAKEILRNTHFRVNLNTSILSAGYAIPSGDASDYQKFWYEKARENRKGLWKKNEPKYYSKIFEGDGILIEDKLKVYVIAKWTRFDSVEGWSRADFAVYLSNIAQDKITFTLNQIYNEFELLCEPREINLTPETVTDIEIADQSIKTFANDMNLRFDYTLDSKPQSKIIALRKLTVKEEGIEKKTLELYKKTPKAKKILEGATMADGTIDMQAVEKMRNEQRKVEVMEKVGMLKDGPMLIKEATNAKGEISISLLSRLVDEIETLERYRNDPRVRYIIKTNSKPDGTIDLEKVKGAISLIRQLYEYLEEVKRLSDSEEITRQVTLEDGSIDFFKLESIIHQRQMELQKQWQEELEKKDKIAQQYNALILKGNQAANQKNHSEALAEYTEAIEFDPSATAGYLYRYQIYEVMNEFEKAIQDISKLITLNSEMAIQGRMQRLDGGYFDLLNRGDLYMQAGKYKEAMEDYTRCLEIIQKGMEKQSNPQEANVGTKGEKLVPIGDVQFEKNDLARIFTRRGNASRKMGEFQRAIEDFTEAITTSTNDLTKAHAYFLRGLSYKAIGEQEKWRSDWENAVAFGSHLEEDFERLSGRRHGQCKWYYRDGATKIVGNYVDGEEHGHFIWYHPDGKIYTDGWYIEGKKDGEWKWYNEDGTFKKKIIYKNDAVQ